MVYDIPYIYIYMYIYIYIPSVYDHNMPYTISYASLLISVELPLHIKRLRAFGNPRPRLPGVNQVVVGECFGARKNG